MLLLSSTPSVNLPVRGNIQKLYLKNILLASFHVKFLVCVSD